MPVLLVISGTEYTPVAETRRTSITPNAFSQSLHSRVCKSSFVTPRKTFEINLFEAVLSELSVLKCWGDVEPQAGVSILGHSWSWFHVFHGND